LNVTETKIQEIPEVITEQSIEETSKDCHSINHGGAIDDEEAADTFFKSICVRHNNSQTFHRDRRLKKLAASLQTNLEDKKSQRETDVTSQAQLGQSNNANKEDLFLQL